MTDPQAKTHLETLIHQVNNLLGVIYTQSAVADIKGDTDSYRNALRLIQDSAKVTEIAAREARRSGGGGRDSGGRDSGSREASAG